LEIRFSDKRLRALCEKSGEATRRLGADCAGKLRRRFSDLEAAKVVADLVAGNPHPLDHDRAGQFAVNLAHGRRLAFVPDHDNCPLLPDGAIDWGAVSVIKIVFIGDYHD
jgi:proteic killer suppression protein